jgi:putative oxidoreductase
VEHRQAARIASSFYGVMLPEAASYVLGVAELILSLALLFGFYRTVSYGLLLLVHTVTVVVSCRQLFDPWGLAKIGGICGSRHGQRGAALPRCS